MVDLMKKHTETIYHFEAIFESNGMGYTVTVPKLPGLVTEGDSLKEAKEMARDAMRCYLESVLKEKALATFRRPRLVRERMRVSV